MNITSSHLVLDGFVNLDPGFSPVLVAAYPALGWIRALRRALQASRTLSLVGRAGTASWLAARRAWLTTALSRYLPPLPRRPLRLTRPPRQHLGWPVRAQYEARRHAVIARHDPIRRLPWADGSVDHILCANILQQLPPQAVGRVLAEYARVLRSGGTLHVVVPDLSLAVERYIRGEIDADELVAWQRLGASHRPAVRRWESGLSGPGHLAGPRNAWHYDEHTARRRLVGAGFRITTSPTPSGWMIAKDLGALHLTAVRV